MKCSPISKNKIVIAIDGFSSCGKSTFAQQIAAKIGYLFIDTGAMYRAVTLYAIQNGAVNGERIDTPRLIKMLPDIHITLRFNPRRKASDIFLNDVNVEPQIRNIEVSQLVSQVSQIAEVREQLVRMQQQLGAQKGVVLDGRDIGTVVFPDAELKIFMTADPKIRAQRRYDELKTKGEEVSLQQIEQNLRERDHADQTREISPLKQAPDAIVLDNTHMTVSQQIDWVMNLIEKKYVSHADRN